MKLLLPLDIQYFAGEKTEKATPKKRRDARKKGQVVKSQDLSAAILLLVLFLFLIFMAPIMFKGFFSFFIQYYEKYILFENVTADTIMNLYVDSLMKMAVIILPVIAVAMVVGVFSNVLQFGFLFTTETLKLDLKKIDPIKGIKKIISVRAVVNLIKSLLKVAFIGTVTGIIIWMNLDNVLSLAFHNPWNTLTIVAKLTAMMGIASAITLLIVAILDYIYEKFEYERNLRMSKQDIKDEYKNTEGDPLIKSKIKQRQREMAMRRMMQEVPKADVVITNPTHYAVALRYDDESMDAPKVVAKGVDFVAQKIKLIAKENDVVLVENRPLARALYDQVEIGEEVPEEFFKAVAEILAYVYRIKRKI
ncbi:flagellar biosynthesis protein FlhB [Ureibacillus thermophilus]|uniref:Flagellar biosynthetic protein FlhB n=1 Tax=Ureibacillus thermophilus TaxID=367743 RepID=A0A4P6UUS6_9BACL|nr:flagellar biosynthesis protein FlhB [Ureibacillus thermophilus]QBK25648.1 flagellar biosynthesis protein FlhB [Ureibacillus thermophilus]